jgi:hypothetical protein
VSKATVDEMLEKLRQLAAPEPPPGLLQRILDSRAAGVRLPLPRLGRDYTRWLVGALAAAAALALIINSRGRESSPTSAETD